MTLTQRTEAAAPVQRLSTPNGHSSRIVRSPAHCSRCQEGVELLALAGYLPRGGDLAERMRDTLGQVRNHPAGAPRASLELVLVPTNRPEEGERPGIALAVCVAERRAAPLLLLRTGAACAARVYPDEVPDTPAGLYVVDLDARAIAILTDRLPLLETGRHRLGTAFRSEHDIALKRNAAVALGHLIGHGVTLMLDDDLTPRSPDPAVTPWPAGRGGDDEGPLDVDRQLADFAAGDDVQAVMSAAALSSDHSVLGHTLREHGLASGTYAGSAALAIRNGGVLSFFPGIYNEDWMFAFGLALDGGLPSAAAKFGDVVFQAPYDPYDETRARAEEIGDLVAEQALSLFGQASPHVYAALRSAECWRQAGEERRVLITRLLGALCPTHSPAYEPLHAALSVYKDASMAQWPQQIASYMRSWTDDQSRWAEALDDLRLGADADLETALRHLGLAPFTRVLHRSGRGTAERRL